MTTHLAPGDRLLLMTGQLHFPLPRYRHCALALARLARSLDWQGRRGHVVATAAAIRDQIWTWGEHTDLEAVLAMGGLYRLGYITSWRQDGELMVLTIDTTTVPLRISDLDASVLPDTGTQVEGPTYGIGEAA